MGSAFWLSTLIGATLLVGCGADAEHADPAGAASGHGFPSSSIGANSDTEPGTNGGDEQGALDDAALQNEGVLTITARSSLQRQLDAIHYVVKNASGEVVAGGDDEAANAGVGERELSLRLPAGIGLRLELTATTLNADASTCTASVGPLSVEAGSRASYQVFVWRCDGAPGAAAPEPECYWLADWMGVTRTSAAIGDRIGLSAAGHDAEGSPARFSWSTAALPEAGDFEDPNAAETSFLCAESSRVPLTVAISGGRCQKTFSQLVACK